MSILHSFWKLVGACGLQTGTDGRPREDRGDTKLGAPRSVKQLHATLGHTRYYRKFIKAYAQITAPMEKLLKKDTTFRVGTNNVSTT